ncbi:MAG: UDP-N-acetylmuramate--L-alanine ligase [Candidatus Omnitrophica bacterium]|nr:UDP-N-acetylmuramate--L-alanine ligase [Candidatus Omnitrophota bacterium]
MHKHYHLIGIGGIGMSGIAHLLMRSGIEVSGSDVKETRITAELSNAGAKIFIGHASSNIDSANLIIYSSAIKEDNPEIVKARKLGIPLIKRAQALAQLMQDKIVVTVAGSHGKTTTTSLIAYLLLEAGFMPTVAVGGILRNIDTNACFGNGKYFVAEADESDGSFLYYRPKYSVITNIDCEHMDYYQNFDNELEAFRQFMQRTEDDGCLFCCDDDIYLKELLKDYRSKYILFGLTKNAHIYPKNILISGLSSEFDCYYKDKFVDRFGLALGGRHNVSNALSVIALGLELGINLDVIKKTLMNYKGAGRRLEIKFSNDQITIIDDYAHHPTEIRATLAAVKNLKQKRIIAVFQPHRFSRTKLLMDEFGKCFSDADYVLVTDIYPASELSIDGVNAEVLCDKIKSNYPNKKVLYLPKPEIVSHILEIIEPEDLVITLGAGDIIKNCEELVERLKFESKVAGAA